MLIAYRFGHNPACQGANGYVNEVTEDRKYGTKVIEYLEKVGHKCVNCTPPDMADSNTELMYGINKANQIQADLFLSFHLNSFQMTASPMGCEVIVYTGDNFSATIGKRVCSNLQDLGFLNRGVKNDNGLAEMKHIKTSSMIIEPFFVSSKADVDLYKKIGADVLGKAIAEGINGEEIEDKKKEDDTMDNLVIYNGDGDLGAATLLASKLNCPIITKTSYSVNQIKANKYFVVGGTLAPNNSVLLSGHNRVETMAKVLEFLKKYE